MKRKIINALIAGTLIITVIFAIGISMYFHSRTIVEWWLPVAICAPAAIIITIPLSRLMKRTASGMFRYIEYPAAFAISFSLLLCLFYFLNYHFSDTSSRTEYDAPIIRKFSQERSRSRKVGRTIYRSEKYNVYFIEIELNDGKTKKIEKPLKEYLKRKKGEKVRIAEEKGLLGLKVLKNIE